jgi:16S rRNA (guanine966-N2)-methyltransferase
MTIKILGGMAKGHSLSVCDDKNLRPTSVIIRRKIFDAYQDHSESIFIDCFAGTGSMGFEAWSRGARACFFIEEKKEIFKQLKINGDHLSQKIRPNPDQNHPSFYYFPLSSLKVMGNSFFKSQLKILLDSHLPNNLNKIFFIDPPYENKEVYLELIDQIKKTPEFFPFTLWVESGENKGWSESEVCSWGFHCEKILKQGDRFIAVLSSDLT